jgi:N6-adenosine-specific RNA methylase IME4
VNAIQSGEFAGLNQNGYGLILADPAWPWRTFSGNDSIPHRTEEQPYPPMPMEEMRALPVADLAAKDCVLIMWVIGSHLDQAIDLGRAWGFDYKTDVFVWVKTGKNDPAVRPISFGKWSRKQVEYALLFSRGKPSRIEANVRQLIETDDHIIYEPKRRHSEKPDTQYERIERLCVGPYVELFARKTRLGWDAWGNEVGKLDDPLFIPVSGGSIIVDEFEALLA